MFHLKLQQQMYMFYIPLANCLDLWEIHICYPLSLIHIFEIEFFGDLETRVDNVVWYINIISWLQVRYQVSYYTRFFEVLIQFEVAASDTLLMSLKLTWKIIYQWERQSYFSSEPFSKTGYYFGVCHGLTYVIGMG